ncbi:MAG: flagellar hook-associated protein FlgL [Rhodoferax sp.]|nr:flagellar hook-associated protein FlgL [Rhodoferax sp.]
MASFALRLGSANTYDNALRNLGTRQAGLANLQENLTSGKRVNRPSDDPTAAAQAERARTRIDRIKADQRALDSQSNAIAQAEGTLGDVTDALQNIRELLVSAGNATFTKSERESVAFQMQGLRDQIFALANRKDTNGQPLFSALGSALTPFVGPETPPLDYTFKGLPGQTASSEVAIPATLDGESAFMHQTARDGVYNVTVDSTSKLPNVSTNNVTVTDTSLITGSSYQVEFYNVGPGATAGTSTAMYKIVEYPVIPGEPPTVGTPSDLFTDILIPDYPTDKPLSISITDMPGLSLTITGTPVEGDSVKVEAKSSIFSVLDDAIRDIKGAINSDAAKQAVGQGLHNIDIGMTRISAVRGQAGDLLNRADRISANQVSRSIQLEADRSTSEDLDMIKGISDFQNQQTGVQAALQSYAQIQRLSLFDYIR